MGKKFQSKTFSLGFLEGEELDAFKKDIISLAKINIDIWEKIYNEIKKIIVAETEKEKNKIYEGLVNSELIENPQNIAASHRTILYFLKKFTNENTKEDKPNEIVHDISTVIDDSINLESIEKLLGLIKQESGWFESFKKKATYDTGLLPFLKGIGTTVELRGMFNHEIEIGENLEKFKERVKLLEEKPILPTITVAITLNSGEPNRFCFQASPEKISWLIKELEAALYKSNLLETRYSK